MPILITNYRTALRHAIAYGVGKLDGFHQFVDILIEGCSANDYFEEVAAERFDHLVAHLCSDLAVDVRHFEQELHGRRFEFRQHVFLDNLLDNERHRNDKTRFDVGKRLEYKARAGRACQEIEMTAHRDFVNKFERQAVHVCHGQHRDDGIALFERHGRIGKIQVRQQATIRQHHALRVARSTRRVVDDGQFVGLFVMIRHMLFTEIFRIFATKQLVQMLACIGQLVVARHQQREIVQQHHAFEVGHHIDIQILPNHIAHKEQFGFGVVHDAVHIVGLELVQNGHRYGAVGYSRYESHAPMRTIAPAQGYFVAFLHTALCKDDVHFFDFARQVFILQCSAIVIGQRIKIPIVFDAVFDCFNKSFVLHN